MKNLLFVTSVILLFPGLAQADSFKCGNKFVSTGDSKAVVHIRCGEPLFAEVISADDERKIEQWTYKSAGYRSFLRILTFSGGRLIDIKVGDRAG